MCALWEFSLFCFPPTYILPFIEGHRHDIWSQMFGAGESPFSDVRVTQAFMQLVESAAVEARENVASIAMASSTMYRGGGSSGGGGGVCGAVGGCAACNSGLTLNQPHQQLSASDVLRRFVASIYERPTSSFYAGEAASVFAAHLRASFAGDTTGSLVSAELVRRAFPELPPTPVVADATLRPPSSGKGLGATVSRGADMTAPEMLPGSNQTPSSSYHYSSCPTVALSPSAEFLVLDGNVDGEPILATAPVVTAERVQELLRSMILHHTGAAFHAPSCSWVGSLASPFSGPRSTAGYCAGCQRKGAPSTTPAAPPPGASPAASKEAAQKRGVAKGHPADGSDDDPDASISSPNNKGGVVRSVSGGRRGSGNGLGGCGRAVLLDEGGPSPLPFLGLPSAEEQSWQEPDEGFHLVVTAFLQDVAELCLDEGLSDPQAQQVLLCADAILQTIQGVDEGIVTPDRAGAFHTDLVREVRACLERCMAALTLDGEEGGTKEITVVRRQPTFKTVDERQLRPEALQAWMARRTHIIEGTTGSLGGSTSPLYSQSISEPNVNFNNGDNATQVDSFGVSCNLTAADLDPSQLPTLPPPTSYPSLNAATRRALIAHDETLLQVPAMLVQRRIRVVEEVPQVITIYSNVTWGSAVNFLKLVQRCVLPNLPLFAFCLQPPLMDVDQLDLPEEELANAPQFIHISGIEETLLTPVVEDVPPGLLPPMGNIHAHALARAAPGAYVPPCATASREQAMQHLHQLLASLDVAFDDRESVATSVAPTMAAGGRASARGPKKVGRAAKEVDKGAALLGLPGITLPGGGTLGMGVSDTGGTYNLLDGSANNPFLLYLSNLSQPPTDPFQGLQNGSGCADEEALLRPMHPPEEPPLPLDIYLGYRSRVAFQTEVEEKLNTLFATLWEEPLVGYYTAHFGPAQAMMVEHERRVRAEDKEAALSRRDFLTAAEVAEHRLKRSVIISPTSPLRGTASPVVVPDSANADTSDSPRQSRGGKGSKKGNDKQRSLSLSAAASIKQQTSPVEAAPAQAPTATSAPELSALEAFLLEASERLSRLEKHVEVVGTPPTSAPAVGGRKQPLLPAKPPAKPTARR